jgi:transposase InsO family protein
VTTPAQRRRLVRDVARALNVSERAACRAVGQPRSTQRYRGAQPRNGERALRDRMRELALRHPRYGYRLVGALLRAEGFAANHKRVRRLWREEGLKVPRKQRKRRRLPGAGGDNACHRRRAGHPDHVWSVDFCFDRTADGRALKVFSVVDEFTRRCLAIEAGRRVTGGDVVRVLDGLARSCGGGGGGGGGGGPGHVRCDNGPEFACAAVRAWAAGSAVGALYVEPGSPWENGYVESYHARLRDELLDREEFATVAQARALLEAWRREYNGERPHGSLGYRTPDAFAAACRRDGPRSAPLRGGRHGVEERIGER